MNLSLPNYYPIAGLSWLALAKAIPKISSPKSPQKRSLNSKLNRAKKGEKKQQVWLRVMLQQWVAIVTNESLCHQDGWSLASPGSGCCSYRPRTIVVVVVAGTRHGSSFLMFTSFLASVLWH